MQRRPSCSNYIDDSSESEEYNSAAEDTDEESSPSVRDSPGSSNSSGYGPRRREQTACSALL